MDENPGAKAYVLHRDIMTPGSVLEAYYRKALQKGVQFIRFDADRPPEVRGQDQVSSVEVFDTISGVSRSIDTELLVLSTPFIADPEGAALARMFNIPVDKYGFYAEVYPIHPVETRNDGIFISGTARWPVSSDQAIAQGEAAAIKAASFLGKETVSALTMSRVPGGKLGHAISRCRCVHGLRQLCRRLPLRGLPAPANGKPLREPRHQDPLQGLRHLRLRLPERGHADARAELPGHRRDDPAGLPGGALTCPPKGAT